MPNNRNQYILAEIDRSNFGLEVGASYNPVAPRRDGWNIEIADHTNSSALREKYARWGVDGGAIEDVDHVINEKGLFSSIGQAERYDFIIASHVIEHVPDFVQFLVDCEKLLKPGGILSLAIPDKRFCFDVLKPVSTLGQILQAHLDKRIKHPPGVIFDAHALHATLGGNLAWGESQLLDDLRFVHSVHEAYSKMQEAIARGEYVDVHAWQFVPDSFVLHINDLRQLGLINLDVVTSSETLGYEFFVTLRKQQKTSQELDQSRRLALARSFNHVSVSSHLEQGVGTKAREDGSSTGKQYVVHHHGWCPICENNVIFVSENNWLRDYLLCSSCLSVPRERAVMHILGSLMPNWRSQRIHESSPSDRATSKKLRSECADYIGTQFDPQLELGVWVAKEQFRNENLEQQTFEDGYFDIVVTQDVLEHILDPAAALQEIARTLRPGGVHVASVPLVRKWEKSRVRARRRNDGSIDYILPPEYHGNPISESGSLVVTDWGYDIAAFCHKHSGMDTMIYHIDNLDLGIRAEYIEILVSRRGE